MKNMKTKRERFETVAAKRVQKLIVDLESLSKCANKNSYEFNEDDVVKMITTIKKKLKSVEDIFNHNLDKSSSEFRF